MSDILNVEKRDKTGTLRMRRLRHAGWIPAILYGHGEENVMLSVDARDVDTIIRHGSHVVELKGAVSESALVKEVQWDGLGSDVLHLDLTRIDVTEAVQVALPIELKGVAPGTKSGGALRTGLHEVEIECPANKLPDKLELNINELELGQSLTAGDLTLPSGARLMVAPDEMIVHCVEVTAPAEEVVEGEAAPAEPEVIGRKKEDEESED